MCLIRRHTPLILLHGRLLPVLLLHRRLLAHHAHLRLMAHLTHHSHLCLLAHAHLRLLAHHSHLQLLLLPVTARHGVLGLLLLLHPVLRLLLPLQSPVSPLVV